MVECGEQLFRLRPRDTRGRGPAGRQMRIAEVDEQFGDEVVVLEGAGQSDAMLVAVDGLGVVAEVVVGVPDAVPGAGGPVQVTVGLEDVEGLAAVRQRLRELAEHRVVPADRVQRLGLAGPVVGAREEREGLFGVLERGGGLFALPPQVREVVFRTGLTDTVAERREQVQRAPEAVVRLGPAAEPDVGL